MSTYLSAIASIAEAVAVITAVVFGLMQVRHLRAKLRREGAFHLVQSLRTPEMLQALHLLDRLPAGLTGSQLENRPKDEILALQVLMGTWESLGILVSRGEVGLDLVDDFYSGSIVQSWQKLRPAVEDLRTETGRETRWEWFQWLAERLLDHEALVPAVPAYLENRRVGLNSGG